MFKATIGALAFFVLGFISFVFLGVLILGSIWPNLPYETALPYLLLFGLIGAILLALIWRKIIFKK